MVETLRNASYDDLPDEHERRMQNYLPAVPRPKRHHQGTPAPPHSPTQRRMASELVEEAMTHQSMRGQGLGNTRVLPMTNRRIRWLDDMEALPTELQWEV